MFADLPFGIRRGHNDRAFDGGFRAWEASDRRRAPLLNDSLHDLRSLVPSQHLRELFAADPARAMRFSLDVPGLHVDYSKHLITSEVMDALRGLAAARGVEALRDRMFAGEPINVTEKRAVMHVALRNRSGRPMLVDGKDVMPEVYAVLDHMRVFGAGPERTLDRLHRSADHRRRQHRHRRIRSRPGDGGGGAQALHPRRASACTSFRTSMPRISARRCSISARRRHSSSIASKTFTTQETMVNARSARAWFLETAQDERAIARHFVALSTNAREVPAFGIAPENMFVFWDWVGGRYSLCSSIGLPVALAVGFDRSRSCSTARTRWTSISGTHHSIATSRSRSGCWACGTLNVLDAETHAVLPYEQYLHRLPAYLQQLDMESNGKRVDA